MDLLGGLDLSQPVPAATSTIQPQQPNSVMSLMGDLGLTQSVSQPIAQPVLGQKDLMGDGGLINNSGMLNLLLW